MTPPQKPEWMELADADSAPTPKKVSRLVPAFIAAIALAIVGVGAIATQISDEPPASANEQVIPTQSASTPASTALTPDAKSSVTPSNAPQAKTPQATPVTPQQPTIATLPKNGGDDDEGEGRGEHRGRGEHEEEDEGDDH